MDFQLVLFAVLGFGVYFGARALTRFLLARVEQQQGTTEEPAEHRVLLSIALGTEGRAVPEDLVRLEEALAEALAAAQVGQIDGHEVTFGRYHLVLRGPDADRLFAALEPLLRASPRAAQATVVKRHGRGSRDVRVEL